MNLTVLSSAERFQRATSQPEARKRNVAEKVKLRGWGADRWGQPSGLTLDASVLLFSSAGPDWLWNVTSVNPLPALLYFGA